MAEEQNIPVDMRVEWFDRTCGNTEAHGLLLKIQDILDKREITQSSIDHIQGKCRRLTQEANWPECPLFCARTIQIMKSLAFLDGAEELCDSVFGILVDAWRAGLRGEEVLQRQYQSYRRVLNPQRVLEGWTRDLEHVREICLPSYLRLLRLKDLHLETAHFGRAIEGFVKRIEGLDQKHANVAAKAAVVFVSEILESLLSPAPNLVTRHVLEATKLIAAAVKLDPGKTLQWDKGDVRRALAKLPSLLQRAGVAREAKDRAMDGATRLGEAYRVLNILHREKPDAREYLQDSLSELMPWLGGWMPRAPRRNGDGWRAIVQLVQQGGPTVELTGTVVDLAVGGRGAHIKWDDRVESCRGFTGEPITVKLRGEEMWREIRHVALRLMDNEDGQVWRCEAQAWRGWVYEKVLNESSSDAGVVFYITKMPDGLAARVEELPQRSGLEALASSQCIETDVATDADLPMVRSSGAPFENRLEGLLNGMHEFLCEMANEIRLRGYWNALWYKKGVPVKERNMGTQLRRSLEVYVRSRGAVFTPQAESGLGPCDYLVERPPDKLWIELKPSYGNWRQGMRKELIQYMQSDLAAARPAAGLLLVLAFNDAFRQDSPDVEELLSIRDRSCQRSGCRVDIAIINCDKPSSASDGVILEKSGDGLRYYEYVSAAPSVASASADQLTNDLRMPTVPVRE